MDINFKEKVQSMTGKEIVMTMVTGLRKRWVEIDMNSFGHTKKEICYGCAATNTICEILGEVPYLPEWGKADIHRIRLKSIGGIHSDTVNYFESAINRLRMGDIIGYNYMAEMYGFSILPAIDSYFLPDLTNNFTEADLQKYEDYANTLN